MASPEGERLLARQAVDRARKAVPEGLDPAGWEAAVMAYVDQVQSLGNATRRLTGIHDGGLAESVVWRLRASECERAGADVRTAYHRAVAHRDRTTLDGRAVYRRAR